MTTTELTTYTPAPVDDYAIIERVAVLGDLSPLNPIERVQYYTALCRSLNLNALTKPFEYLQLDGKLVLYATRGATDQIRDSKRVSVRVARRETNVELGVYIVEVEASTSDGRVDFATGAVAISKEGGEWNTTQGGKRFFKGNGIWEALRGTDLANAMMKAETKAKRRATLSIAGLGFMDESEAVDVPRAQMRVVNVETGEIVDTNARTAAVAELQRLAVAAKGLGLDTGLAGRKPKEMSDQEIAEASAVIAKMLESEYAQIEQPVEVTA